ncbi:MAG: hypothetical protein ABMB14_15385 [Myxococcota bacterium]
MADTPFDRTVDELELQAWLARAEFTHPSLRDPQTRSEADALARLRDELRLQLHLGKLEAKEEFQGVEERWSALKRIASTAASEAEEKVHDVLAQIRDRYTRLRG